MPPLSTDAAKGLLTGLGNQAKYFLSPNTNPLFDPAGFIADPNDPPVLSRAPKAIARQACRAWARQSGPSTNPYADNLFGGICGPYLDDIGEGVAPGEIGPPFQGGQCSQPYLIDFDILTAENARIGGGPAVTHGPIVGVRRVALNDSNPPNYSLEVGSHSSLIYSSACVSTSDQGFSWRQVSTVVGGSIKLKSVSPCGDDSCGNPPPEYERPRPPITLPPITPIFVDLPDIGPININVDVDADGNITIDSPTLDVEVGVGSPGSESGGGSAPSGVVPDSGLSGPPADTGSGGTASGVAPDGQELVGVRVEVLEAPFGFNQYGNNSAVIYRGVGYVRMGYPGRLALDMGGSALISPQFFLAPVRGLTAWEVRANLGFINRCTPFYREIPQ